MKRDAGGAGRGVDGGWGWRGGQLNGRIEQTEVHRLNRRVPLTRRSAGARGALPLLLSGAVQSLWLGS